VTNFHEPRYEHNAVGIGNTARR